MGLQTTTSTSGVANLGSIARGSAAAAGRTVDAQEAMGREAFLTLFTTQLQNQNPLDPVKNEAFVAQLAQFSQLEATTRMADALEAQSAAAQSERILAGAALIGRKVAAPDGMAQLLDGRTISGVISVPEGASSVRLNVYDERGRSVYTQQLGRQEPGEVVVRWDGTDQTGGRMPAGRYSVTATVDSFGKLAQIPITTPTTVRSVSYSSVAGGLMLELDDGAMVPLSQVKRIDG